MIEYTGDNSVFPSEADAIFGWIGAASETRHKVHGNHHGQAIRDDAPSGQLEAGKHIRAWLADNGFGSA
jgi:hypothetical protein